ncbi:hypothetical protein [uncultured Algibacter sp.]|uniref:hypothetical protein n=1 Tax=uncultured Algibacter sp. TaxID=298659 RepID=UPI0032175C84
MFKNLTYKQKFFAVIGGFVILFLASYKKTFKHVLSASHELNLVEKKLSNNQNAINELIYLKNEIVNLEKTIGGQTQNPEHIQQELLDFISKNSLGVNIVSIEDVHLFSDNGFLIYTNQIELEGRYSNLVEILYDIEKKVKNSRVVSANIYSKKNYRTKTKTLYLKIILQNYENSK